jgi:adenine-specific DNA-methyltransferase
MPTLHWIGKEKVINHHMDVPFRILEHSYGFENGTQTASPVGGGLEGAGNKIIHGDNLEALKSLLPEYEEQIKCIYIDPPYNTGNENWVYNDNVNDPKIIKWLGQVVGKEAEDLTRHDKWLCMMYPRLKLLHKLLADDGAIFISIDDNEQANLKLVCDEIFGGGNLLTSFVWKKRSGSNDAKNFLSIDHEYIVSYQKSNKVLLKGIIKGLENYKNPDNDINGSWTTGDLTCNKTKVERPNLFYDITDPKTGIVYSAKSTRVWVYERERMQRMIEQGKVLFPKNGKGTPQYKRHVSELRNISKPVSSWILPSNLKEESEGIKASINSIATKELRGILGDQLFDYPKPIDLISNLIDQLSEKNSFILDSFAGSGTTAHAVLNLNKQDGGNRKFICIEMESYAETITSERVKRVIKGYGTTESTGGSFDFYELGQPMFLEDGNLNELVGIAKIRQYVYYTETKTPLTETKYNDNKYFLGKHNDTGYYFNYEEDGTTTLDHAFLATMKTKAEQYVIYADNCLLTKDYRSKHNIIFKKIPRDITRF